MLTLGNKLTLNSQPIYHFVNKYSVQFDGSDQRIITDGADTVAQPTTYSFWCKATETGNNKGVFGHGGQHLGGFHFNASSDRPLLWLGTSFWVYWDDTSAQDDGEWHHWVVYADTNNVTNSKLYVDGVLQTINLTADSGNLNAYTESLTIGSDRQVGGNSFEGKIDEFAVYDRELTQAEITRMYNTYYSPNRVANGNFAQIGNEEVTNGDFSQIGSELVTNGDFSSASGWSGSISVAGGQGTKTGSGLAYQDISAGLGTDTFKVVVDVAHFENNLKAYVGGTQVALVEGINTLYIKSGGSNNFIGFNNGYNTGTNTGAIINSISVKEVGQDWSLVGDFEIDDTKAFITSASQYSQITSQQGTSFLTNGKTYKLEADITTSITNALAYRVQGGAVTPISTSDIVGGKYTAYFTMTQDGYFWFQTTGAYTGLNATIDNVSVKEVGQHWTFGTGWSMGDGVANATDAAFNSQLTDSTTLVAGKEYKISFNVSNYVKGNVNVTVGNVSSSTVSANGSYTFNLTTSLTTPFRVSTYAGGSGTTLSVDNIVVQELKHDATNLMLNAGAYQSANPLITSTKSMEFDGSDQLLTTQADTVAQNTTYSFWAKTSTTSRNVVFGHGGVTIGCFSFNYDGNRPILRTGNAKFLYFDDVTQQKDDKWHHWVVYMDYVDLTNSKLYCDGVLQNVDQTSNTGTINAYTQPLTIGADNQAGDNEYEGLITEFGTWDRELTSLEVASLYNQGMPTNLLVNRNNYQSGNPTVFNTKQVDFDGVDDYMDLGTQSATSSLTYSAWVYYEVSSGSRTILALGQTLFRIGNATTINLWSDVNQIDTSVTITDIANRWSHIVVTQTGTTVNVYQDGVLKGTNSSATSVQTSAAASFIGKFSSTWFFNGKISQIGVWNEALTSNEVSSLYNHGLPIDLTTDQAAYESSSNLVGYWRMGSGTLDNYPSIGSDTYGVIADQTNATLGDELIVNGDFATDTNWTKNSGWTISGGKARRDGIAAGGNSPISQTVNLVAGKVYKLSYDRTYISNGGETNLYSEFITDGSYTTLGKYNDTTQETVTIVSYFSPTYTGAMPLNMYGIGTFTGTVDNVSLKEFGGNPAIMTNQTSSDIENGSPYANIVQNGTFDTDSDWSYNASYWSISGGTANALGVANGGFSQTLSVTSGNTYEVKISSTITSGNGIYSVSLGTNQQIFDNNTSEITTSLVASGDNVTITIHPGASAFSMSSITVEEVNTGLQGYWKMGDGTNDEYPVIYDQVDPTLGSELITNGNFATDSDWTLGTGATISNNLLNFNNVNNDETRQSNVFPTPPQGIYEVSFDISNYVGGHIDLYLGGYQRFDFNANSNGTWKQLCVINHPSSNTIFYFIGDNFTGSIDNVSAKEVQGNPATMTNMLEGNITNQFPLTKIRNYYRMGDGILDGYPIIQDQTSPNLAHIPTTNFILYSNSLTQSPISGNITTTFNYGVAPDGTTTSTRAVSNGTYNANFNISTSINNSTKYILSGYFKLNSGTPINASKLETYSGLSLNVNLFDEYQNGNLTNEWRRFTSNTAISSSTSCTVALRLDSAVDIEFWGIQLEEQSQATAYIKSDGIAAVRKATTTNLVPYSEDFTQWTRGGGQQYVTSNYGISPDGTQNADRILFTNSDQSVVFDDVTTSGVTSGSVYVKGTSGETIRFGINSSESNFTLDGNWQRLEKTRTSSGGVRLSINTYSSATARDILVWGGQLEEQTQAETYAPTFGLPVTIDLFTENNYGTMTNMSSSDIVEDTP